MIVVGTFLIFQLNIVWLMVYKLNHPLIEQYKIQKEEEWPWIRDLEGWRKLVRKSFLICLFNNTIT